MALLSLCVPLAAACAAQQAPGKAELKARALLEKGKVYKAIAQCNDHLDRGTVDPGCYVVRAEAYNRIGEHLKAEADARRALGHSPSADAALLQLGIAEQGLGRNDSALVHLQRATMSAASSSAWFHLALTHQQIHEPRAALDDLQRMDVPNAPLEDRVRVHRLRGECLAEVGDTAAARMAYDTSLALAPRDPVTWNSRGFHRFAAFGEYSRAVQDYDMAVKLNPNYSYAFNNRGWSLYKLGDVEKALKNIDLALRKKPTNAFAYRNLGIIRVEQGDVKEGCNTLRKALELGYTELYGPDVEELVERSCPQVPASPKPAPPPPSNAPGNTPPTRTNAP